MRPENPSILGSKGQRSRSRDKNIAFVGHGALVSAGFCYLLLLYF